MDVSVCLITYNEEQNILPLLNALLHQSLKPSEIIIVDAKSSDRTVNKINSLNRKDIKLKVVSKRNIGYQRNVSIRKASNSVIAMTDAGCVPSRDWLRNLLKPLMVSDVDISAGVYKIKTSNQLSKLLSLYLGYSLFDKEPGYLPSTASVAFKKYVWEKIGGFDETLDKAGEDTKFFYEAVKKDMKIDRVGDATVYWNDIKGMNIKDLFFKLQKYARGDVKTKIWWHPAKKFKSHNIKVLTVFLRYILFVISLYWGLKLYHSPIPFLSIFVFYLLWSIFKHRKNIKDWGTRLLIPYVQIVSDFAVMSGFLLGLLDVK